MASRLKQVFGQLKGRLQFAPRPAPEPVEVHAFDTLDGFLDFYRSRPTVFGIDNVRKAAQQAATSGIHCPVFDEHVAPGALAIHGENYRESLVHRGLNSRLRAVQYVLQNETAHIPDKDLRLYAPEAVTAYANILKSKYENFVGSEYDVDPAILERIGPIRIEDLHALTFETASFDAAVSNEVFEHVPFLDKALSELARILVPGGKLVSTFPFLSMQQDGIVRAQLQDGKIVHLTEPEYHGNPVDAQGSLVFELPGWSIVERTRTAGFKKVEMRWVYSPSYGMIAPDTAGIFVMVATK
jgi:hypothetical protein